MSHIQSDIAEDFINKGKFNVDIPGPLHVPIRDLKVKRDKKLKLILTTTSTTNSSSSAIDHPPGTVRINNDALYLTSISGSKVKINAIQPFTNTISTDSNGTTIRTELSEIGSIEATIGDVDSGKYLIEWLENVDDGYYMWPESVETITNDHILVSIGLEPHNLKIQEELFSQGLRRSSVFLSIDGHQLHLVSSDEDPKSMGVKSGYIVYLEIPSSEIRKKIRNCLSFILGRPLIETGHSIFNQEWQLISFQSISAYSIKGAAFSIYSSPPTPLGKNYQGEIDSSIINRLVNSIYTNYDKYKFGHLSWVYWHAVCAPIHIAAVHFGACIESLQKSYIENHGKVFSTSLIESKKWKRFRQEILQALSSLELNEVEKTVLENKIKALNQTPQSILTKRFLSSLDMNFSKAEKDAWQQRNNAAHGNEIENGSEIQLIRELKILQVIFHRVLLKIVGGGEYYIDYHSIGFPIKSLSKSIDTNI